MDKEYKGFIAPQPITPDQWVLGASNTSPFPVTREDGNWTPFLPQNEKQNIRGIETFNCTGFNTINALEILMSYKFNVQVNYSDRWLGIIAGTKAPGNDPHKVAEAIREYGLIPESMLPFSDDINNTDEYYSFKGMNADQIEACYAEGRKWKEMYNFNHSWVYRENQPLQEKINNMKVGLKSSPLGIALFAWASDARDVYYANGEPNHWTTVYNIDKFLEVIDTYEPFRKLVEQNIVWCKMYSIEKKEQITEEQKKGFMAQLAKILEWLGITQKQFDTLIKTPPPAPIPPQIEPLVPQAPKYQWDTKVRARHSVRVICDEEKLTVELKNILTACVKQESDFNPKAISKPNKNGTRDWGIVQINDGGNAKGEKFWIGKGKLFKDTQEVLDNPEKGVRFMAKETKKYGYPKWWSSFTTGAYKKWL